MPAMYGMERFGAVGQRTKSVIMDLSSMTLFSKIEMTAIILYRWFRSFLIHPATRADRRSHTSMNDRTWHKG